MPDAWEQSKGGKDLLPNGHELHAIYDNIEVYLNALSDSLVGPITAIALTPVSRNHISKQSLTLLSRNPLTHRVKLVYELQNKSQINLSIYNINGQQVKKLVGADRTSGSHSIIWDRRNQNGVSVKDGIYFARMSIGNKIFSQKLVVLR